MEEVQDKIILSIIETIKAVQITEMGALIYPENKGTKDVFLQTSPYIKFLPIVCSIEFLGAIYDELPFETTRIEKEDIVEKRFNKALKELFDKKYKPFIKSDSKHYLYKKLRCPIIHQMRPGSGIGLTTRKEAVEDGNEHMKENKAGRLILVLEDFYDDLNLASHKMIRLFETNKITNKKGDNAFLSISKL
jgi:hypothetical protein